MFINDPQLLALYVSYPRERLIEAGTRVRRPARRTSLFRRPRRG